MHHYKIYGLRIASTRKIDLLKEIDPSAETDLTVEWKTSTPHTPDNGPDWEQVHSEMLKLYAVITLWKNENSTITKVCFELEGREPLNFVFDANRKLLSIYHHSEESRGDLESYLVGPALGIVMRLRGIVCLHSSVVAINGNAIALLGHSTAGKSTLAAGLAEAGAKILADDIAVVTTGSAGFYVHPGYSKIRLRPVAAKFLTPNPDSLPIVYSHRDSRYVSLSEETGFEGAALPLSSIYVLGEFSEEYRDPFIKPLETKDKLIRLLQNTYGSYVVMDELRANEFKVLSKIAQTIPMRKLFYAQDIETLPKQCEIILEDFRSLPG